MSADKAESVDESLGATWSLEGMVCKKGEGWMDRNVTKENCGLFVPCQQMSKGTTEDLLWEVLTRETLYSLDEKSSGVHVETDSREEGTTAPPPTYNTHHIPADALPEP